MNFRRVKEKDDIFARAYSLYETSFPEFEQRSKDEQVAILSNKEYHFDVIYDEDNFVGLMLYWETASFVYVEHFCIDSTIRGKGYGQEALKALRKKNKTIILEIDPPVDEISFRRKGFYLRADYCENRSHIHPPYKHNLKGHELVVLSYPSKLSEEQYVSFGEYLKNTVMCRI